MRGSMGEGTNVLVGELSIQTTEAGITGEAEVTLDAVK